MTNLLDEDRTTRMRSTVMAAVADDTRRRGQKMRRRLGVTAAAAAVLVVGTVGTSLVTAPGGGDDRGADTAMSSSAAQDSAGRAALEDVESSAAQDGDDKSVAPIDDATTREVVVTGSASLTVKDPRDAATRLAGWVEGHGGRIDAREIDDSGDAAHAFLTLRVPAGQVTATLKHLESYGDVTGVSVSNDDVTATGRDLDARIKALRISIDRLEAILSKASSSRDVVAAEQALTQRQEQLEQLTTQRRALSEQVALATLSVDLSAHEKTGTVDPGGFRGGLKDGWNALVDVVNRLVEGLGAALPWLGVLALLYAAYRGVRTVRRRQHREP